MQTDQNKTQEINMWLELMAIIARKYYSRVRISPPPDFGVGYGYIAAGDYLTHVYPYHPWIGMRVNCKWFTITNR